MWASVQKPNETFDPASWEVRAVLTEAQAKALSDEAKVVSPKGIKIAKDDAAGELSFRFRRKVLRPDGSTNTKPVVLYPGKTPYEGLIGNGSVGNVQYSFIAYDNKFGKGVTVDLKGVQVVTLVPYGVADGEEFEELPSSSPVTAQDEFNDEEFS
jgi:hypothetical protein